MTQDGTRVGAWAATLVLLAAAGCSDDKTSNARDDAGTQAEEESLICEERQEEADALLEANARCDQDADCMVAWLEVACLNSFLCPNAVRKDTDLEQLKKEAEALSTAYKEDCVECAMADCSNPAQLAAVCVNHMCTTKFAQASQ